jgi:ankyrin repeat protein
VAGEGDAELVQFLKAAEKGDREALASLCLENPGLLSAEDSEGYGALHRAAYSDQPEAVTFLLGEGAFLSARTHDGWTPLHSAARWNAHRVVKILLTHGADVNAISNGGTTNYINIPVCTLKVSIHGLCFAQVSLRCTWGRSTGSLGRPSRSSSFTQI